MKNHINIWENILMGRELSIDLYRGKTGLLIFYEMYEGEKQSVFDCVLKEIIQHLPSIHNLDIPTGITGIGYGILSIKHGTFSLKQEILRHIDDCIYCNIVNQRSTSLSLYSGNSALAKMLYLYLRIVTNGETNRYKKLANRECLVLLIAEMKELLFVILNNSEKLLKDNSSYLIEIGQCFILICCILDLNINKNYCQDTLIAMRKFIHSYLNDISQQQTEYNNYILRLLYSYVYVAHITQDIHMKQKGKEWSSLIIPNIVCHNNIDMYMIAYISKRYNLNKDFKYTHINIDQTPFTFEGYLKCVSSERAFTSLQNILCLNIV